MSAGRLVVAGLATAVVLHHGVLGVLLLCDAGSLAWAAAGHHAPRVLPAGALAGVVIGLGTAWLVVAAVGLAALAFLLRTGRLSL